ncbi:MAG: hypothetical protein ACOC0U_01680 [Desulfovibrionales bacterium]
MGQAKVTFFRMVFSSQEYARDENEAVGTIYFTVEHAGRSIDDSADIRQQIGPKYQKSIPTISDPEKTRDLLEPEDFRRKAGEYIQDLVWRESSAPWDTAAAEDVPGTRRERIHEIGHIFNKTVTKEIKVIQEESKEAT